MLPNYLPEPLRTARFLSVRVLLSGLFVYNSTVFSGAPPQHTSTPTMNTEVVFVSKKSFGAALLALILLVLALGGCSAPPTSVALPEESSFSADASEEELAQDPGDLIIEEVPPPLAGGSGSSKNTVPKSAGRMSAEIFKLCNEIRVKNDLPPFIWSDELYKVASTRSQEIIVSFSHTRPNGKSCLSLFEEHGLKYSHVGENVAIGHSSARQVVDSWMNSKGHKANILGPSTHFAVAYKKCPEESIYHNGYAFAQEFMTPR